MKNNGFQMPAPASNGNRLHTSVQVAIIGGGFSGTVLAAQLLRADSSINLAIIDKASFPCRGIAYSTSYGCHLLNIPACNMSALAGEPDHFLQWARAFYDPAAENRSFLPRAVFGKYLESLLKESAARIGGNGFQFLQDETISLSHDKDCFTLRLKSGHEVRADVVVLALGNLPPRDPEFPGLAKDAKRFISFAWSPSAFQDLPDDGTVLLLGTGLTSVDMAAALNARKFRGTIHMLSRRGLIPQRHEAACQWAQFWNEDSPATARGLLRLIRDQVRAAAAAGMDWRGVIDALRPATQDIWRSLPPAERRRFLRHARPYWEVHRHRIAPEIDDLISALRSEGRLHIHAGRITGYLENDRSAEIKFRCRKTGVLRRLLVDRVINCTGSEFDCRRTEDPLLSNLFASGMATPGPLSLGLDVDSNGALLDARGLPSSSFYAIGPMRKGVAWETTAVPEIRRQAFELASHLVRKFTSPLQLKLS